jgi:hypothetical protein
MTTLDCEGTLASLECHSEVGVLAPGPTDSQTRLTLIEIRLAAAGWRKEEPNQISVERPMLIRKMAEVVYGAPLDYRCLAAACHMLPHEAERLLTLYAAPKSASANVISKVVTFPLKRANA